MPLGIAYGGANLAVWVLLMGAPFGLLIGGVDCRLGFVQVDLAVWVCLCGGGGLTLASGFRLWGLWGLRLPFGFCLWGGGYLAVWLLAMGALI